MKNARIRQLCRAMRAQGVKTALITELEGTTLNENLYYLSGYEGVGVISIDAHRESAELTVAPMELERARQAWPDVKTWGANASAINTIKDHLRENPHTGMDLSTLRASTYAHLKKEMQKTRITDIGQALAQQRMIKDEQEITLIKKSCRIASGIMQECLAELGNMHTERDVATFIAQRTLEKKCTSAFPTIVASAKGSAQPHHTTSDKRLTRGFCIIDFGVRYKQYCSDITRTAFIGKPTEKEMKQYETTLRAQRNAVSSCTIGVRARSLHMQTLLDLAPYSHAFIHGLGHGFGLAIHEQPRINASSEQNLLKGMTITIEPGIYFPNSGGIRIEDDILIGTKPLVLTRCTHELVHVRIQ